LQANKAVGSDKPHNGIEADKTNRIHMKIALIIFSITCVSFGFTLNGKVTFEIPKDYKDMGSKITDSLQVYQWYISSIADQLI
jgi:hypothetical protein